MSSRIRKIGLCAGQIALSVATARWVSGGWRSCAAYVVGHFVPTTAVLTTPARNKAKALFRLKAPALLRSSGDDSKAAHLRQPPLSRHCPDLRCFYLFTPTQRAGAAQALGVAALPWASSRSGAEPGVLSKTAL